MLQPASKLSLLLESIPFCDYSTPHSVSESMCSPAHLSLGSWFPSLGRGDLIGPFFFSMYVVLEPGPPA